MREQKAQCVEWYFKFNSMVRVQSNFRRTYPGQNAPSLKAIKLWVNNFRQTGSVHTRKSLGRPKLTRIKGSCPKSLAVPKGTIQNFLHEQFKMHAACIKQEVVEPQDYSPPTLINMYDDANNVTTSEECASVDEKLSIIEETIQVKIEDCQNEEFDVKYDSLQLFEFKSPTRENVTEAGDVKKELVEDFECSASNISLNASDKNVETICIKSEQQNNERNQEVNKKSKTRIECQICNKKFSKFGFKHHMRSHGAFPCNICDSHCTSKSELLKHLKTHNEKPFECDLCHTTFTAQRSLIKHKETHLDGAERERRFQCNLCEKRFYTRSNRDYHTMRHKAKSFTCGICGKQLATKFNLKSHLQLHSSEKRERSHKCHVCDKTYLTRTHLNDHVRNHTGEKPHKCDVCGKEFARRTDWLRHTKSVHLNSFTCELCGKILSSRHTLNVHLKQQTCTRRKKVT